ncbi:MAG: hypothetical protein LBT24_04920, partial [Tannerella sp.]|nr:hypothetical protein [Tannerella sp.]
KATKEEIESSIYNILRVDDISPFKYEEITPINPTEKVSIKFDDNQTKKEEYIDEEEIKETDIRLKTGDVPYSSYFGKGLKDSNSLSEITVQNGTKQDAVVIFINVQTDKCMRNIYILANSNYTIKQIPEGIYKMKCFYGIDWDNNLNNGIGFPVGGFKRNISFMTTSLEKDYFDMQKKEIHDGYSYPTYSVTLHKVQNGNMQTKNISKSDFFD